MKSLLISIIVIIAFGNTGISQISKKESKTITKAISLYDKQEYQKAIDKLAPVLKDHPFNQKLWEINIEFYFQDYQKTYKSIGYLLESLGDVKIENDDGTTSKVSISSQGNFGLDDFLEQCMISTRLIENITSSNIYLRNYLIDSPVDTAISSEAKAAFNGAEVEFQKHNYTKAIELYNKALEIEPDFFKASMYLGDCHWADGRPAKAVEYFKEASEKQPNLLEPRKYLTDAYIDLKEYDNALIACVDGIITFPDSDMFRRMSKIANRKGLNFDRHWMPREFDLNRVGIANKEIIETPWKFYREAKSKIEPFCDENGVIIKENDLTKQHYMETYCWEYMLENTKNEDFEFARKALVGGYLDCFTLISMYHITLHSQFEDFAKYNASKIKDYFKLMLISEK